MTASDHIVTLNDYSHLSVEQRTRSSGKQHVTMTVKSEVVVVNCDPDAIGKPVAEAIAKAIADGIRAISEVAKEGTLAARKAAAAALARGEAWAVKKYSGGRTGTTPPNQSDRAYNDSGRLANGITANASTKNGTFTINAPANRLDPATFTGDGFQRMVDRLVELVPALRNPFSDIGVQRTLRAVEGARHQKLRMEAAEKQAAATSRVVVQAAQWFARLVA